MARPASTTGLTLAQLERLMRTRRTELARLTRKRDGLQRRLDAIDSKIDALSGGAATNGSSAGAGGGRGRRARNAASLQDTIHQVLSKAGGAMSVGDIVAKVLATGYRSNSANFRGIVNQTLIKDKRFSSASRGMYQVKK
jgi:hypothetical protein